MARTGLRDLVGQVLTVGIPGPRLDPATRAILEELRPGGVVLFRRNSGEPESLRALTAELHALPSQPLVCIDHEGGRVHRLAAPFTHFPAAVRVGATGNIEDAYQVGLAMGRELASVGIDLSYAPVLDVHSNPTNPVIGDRAYSADPAVVANCGLAMAAGLEAGGVLVCGKHFPGHGDTTTDSHFELPTVRRRRASLERTELVPFRTAIAAGIPMLMSSHIIFTALDAKRPATLSRAILTKLLRRELRFEGVIASDDMEMKAITANQSMGSAAVQAVAAGVDSLLVCQDLEKAREAAKAITQAVRRDRLTRRRLEEAAARLRQLRLRHAQRLRYSCPLPNPLHQQLADRLS